MPKTSNKKLRSLLARVDDVQWVRSTSRRGTAVYKEVPIKKTASRRHSRLPTPSTGLGGPASPSKLPDLQSGGQWDDPIQDDSFGESGPRQTKVWCLFIVKIII
jgi:hypothetical protein